MRFQRVRVKILKKTGCESLNCSCPVVVAGPGDVFGELALLYNCPRAASVEAGGRPSILMYFASVWIRLLVVDSTPLRGFQTLAAPTARKATEEAVVWQLDRETFSHIVRDASAKRREAFQDFLNLGKAWRGVSRSSYVVGSWNNGGVRDCENVFVNVCDLHPALVGSYSIYGMWPPRKTVPLFKPLESYDLMYSTQCQCNFGAWSHGVSTVVTYQGSWLIACSRRAWMLDRTLAERGLGHVATPGLAWVIIRLSQLSPTLTWCLACNMEIWPDASFFVILMQSEANSLLNVI